MSTFRDFRDNGPAQAMTIAPLGLDISKLENWRQFTAPALHARPAENGDFQPFIDRVDRCAGTAATGELALLMAILCAMDYRWLAEKVGEDRGRSFLQLMEYTTGDHALAVAACIEYRDDGSSRCDAFLRDLLCQEIEEVGALHDPQILSRVIETLGTGALSVSGMEAAALYANASRKR